jgi:uncharacterized protein
MERTVFADMKHLKKSIWFDFENAPHVWVLKEFIPRLTQDGWNIVLTARDFSSTLALCDRLGVPAVPIGENSPSKSSWAKGRAVMERGFALRNYLYRQKWLPSIAVSHGSRSQAFAAYWMGIPAVSLDDYEHSFRGFNCFVKNILTPFPIEKKSWGLFQNKVIHYPGLKEELYLWKAENTAEKDTSCLRDDSINIVFRPEGRFTHYSSEVTKVLQDEVVEIFSRNQSVHIILFSRDKDQENYLLDQCRRKNISVVAPVKAMNGPALIAHADLMVGGGGTMTREACILDVPSYSFFGGIQGGVDAYLEKIGKLIVLKTTEDIQRIQLLKRKMPTLPAVSKDAFNFVYRFMTQSQDTA